MLSVDLMKNPKSRTVKSSSRFVFVMILLWVATFGFIEFIRWLSSFGHVPWSIFAVAVLAGVMPEIHYWPSESEGERHED
jgi:Na+/melibiose symporter-like transporter